MKKKASALDGRINKVEEFLASNTFYMHHLARHLSSR